MILLSSIFGDGHGNFGNIEGDGAAAMRYTEARLQRVTQEAYLADLDKDVVDFVHFCISSEYSVFMILLSSIYFQPFTRV